MGGGGGGGGGGCGQVRPDRDRWVNIGNNKRINKATWKCGSNEKRNRNTHLRGQRCPEPGCGRRNQALDTLDTLEGLRARVQSGS